MKHYTIRRLIILLIAFLCMVATIISCNKDEEENPYLKKLVKIGEAKTDNDLFTFQLYAEDSILITGYNKIYLRALNADNKAIASVQWRLLPLTGQNQSCPVEQPVFHSTGLYSGALVLTDTIDWYLQIDGLILDIDGIAELMVTPENPEYTRLYQVNQQSQHYYVSYVGPNIPANGTNAFEIAVFKKQDQLQFSPVSGMDVKAIAYLNSNPSQETEYTLAPYGDGHYRSQVILDASGLWSLSINLVDGSDTILEEPVFIVNIP